MFKAIKNLEVGAVVEGFDGQFLQYYSVASKKDGEVAIRKFNGAGWDAAVSHSYASLKRFVQRHTSWSVKPYTARGMAENGLRVLFGATN